MYVLLRHWAAWIRLQRSKYSFNLAPINQYSSMLPLKNRFRPWKMCLTLKAPFWVWIFSSITWKAHHSDSRCGILHVNNYSSNTEDSPWGLFYSISLSVSPPKPPFSLSHNTRQSLLHLWRFKIKITLHYIL